MSLGIPPLNKATGRYTTVVKTFGATTDGGDAVDRVKLCIEGTGKAYRVADIRLMSGTIGSVPSLIGIIQIPSFYPDYNSGVPSSLYEPTTSVVFNGPIDSQILAMFVQSESAPSNPYIFIDDWPVYDSDVWLYVHSTQSGEKIICSVTLEEVELTEIGKLASLARITNYKATRYVPEPYVEPA